MYSAISMGPTRTGELNRTAEVLVEIAEKYEGNALRIVAETLFMLRSANRIKEQDLSDLQIILDEKLKK